MAPRSPAPPASTQGPPSPPLLRTPQMADNPVLSRFREAHVVVHIPSTLEAMVISSDDKLMADPDEDPAEDPEFEIMSLRRQS